MGILCFDGFALIMIYIGWDAVFKQRLLINLHVEPQSIKSAGWCFMVGGCLILIASLGFILHLKAIGMLFVVGFVVLVVGLFSLAFAYQGHRE